LYKGRHLLIDCRNVAQATCLDDKTFLQAMARAADRAGANVISQVRYRFGQDSPPGFAAICLLDESHVSAHSYADLGLIALDIFTCGGIDPHRILDMLVEEIGLGEIQLREVKRFETEVALPS
jgi:S-adenosylmethionine decarboxylase